MNIENGTIINQYKIISAIGKRGMGEVCRLIIKFRI